MVAALGGDGGGRGSGGAAAARRVRRRAGACGARRASRSFILPTELFSVATMSARNSALSAWRSALRATSDNWLTRFLTSWRMKAKRRLNSSNRWAFDSACLAVGFGERAGRLAPGGAQQVEIFPVERRGGNRARRAAPGRPAGRGGSAECRPRHGRRRASSRAVAMARSCASPEPWRCASSSRIAAFAFDRQPEAAAVVGIGARRRSRPASSMPRPARSRRASSATSSSPPGASTMSAKALTTPLAERRRVGPDAADGVGEAQPFGAIIVAVLEQMLGELDLGPAARARPTAAAPSPPRSCAASTATAAARDQSQPVPRSAVARIVITAKYPQMASSDKDWKVAARDRRMRQPSSLLRAEREQGRGQARPPRRASRTGRAPTPGRDRRACRG